MAEHLDVDDLLASVGVDSANDDEDDEEIMTAPEVLQKLEEVILSNYL